MNEPRTKAGKALLGREAYNSRSFAIIRPEDIVAIEKEAADEARDNFSRDFPDIPSDINQDYTRRIADERLTAEPVLTSPQEEWDDGYMIRDESAYAELVEAYSYLENYGDHHEWCREYALARKHERHVVDCNCGYVDALAKRPATRRGTPALHLLVAAERGRLGDAAPELARLAGELGGLSAVMKEPQ